MNEVITIGVDLAKSVFQVPVPFRLSWYFLLEERRKSRNKHSPNAIQGEARAWLS